MNNIVDLEKYKRRKGKAPYKNKKFAIIGRAKNRLIEWFGYCRHEWVTFDRINVVDEHDEFVYREYHSYCRKCGELKKVKL